MAAPPGGKKPASDHNHGGDKAKGGGGHDTGHNVVSEVWGKTRNFIKQHLEPAHEKPSAKGAGHPESRAIRFLKHPFDEGAKVVKELVAHRKADSAHGAHIERMTPKEREQQHVREARNNGRTTHYDEHGRVDKAEGKNRSKLEVHYDKSGKPKDVTIANAEGKTIKSFERSATLSINVNQTTNEVLITDRGSYKGDTTAGQAAEIPAIIEQRLTVEGARSELYRDTHGKRLQSSLYGPDAQMVSRTRYKYSKPTDRNNHDSSVVASECGADGHLKREFKYKKPEAVEKNDPSSRIDHKSSQDKPGRFSESTSTYDLHKDKHNPVAKSERINDFNIGEIKLVNETFEGKTRVSKTSATFNEMGKATGLQIDRDSEKIHVDIKFNGTGGAKSVTGDKGALTESDILRAANREIAIHKSNREAQPMAHELLLAYRGPTEPRAGEKPSGTLVYRDGNHFTQRKVVQGEMKDATGKIIGHVNDKGEVEIGGKKFNILDDSGKSAAFTGIGSDGRYLDLTQGQSKAGSPRNEGFSGYISNGADSKIVLGGHMFGSRDNSFFGQFDKNGKGIFAQELDQKESDGTCLSAVLKGGYQFQGNENGRAREFDLDRTSHGQVKLALDGKMQSLDLNLGMLIDPKTQEQIGKYKPPTLGQNGSFDEGYVIRAGKVETLSSLGQSTFSVQIDGQDKVMRGYVLGPLEIQPDGSTRPNSGGIVDLDAYVRASKEERDHKAKDLAQAQEQLKALEAAQRFDDPESRRFSGAPAETFIKKEIEAKQKAYDEACSKFIARQGSVDKVLAGTAIDGAEIERMKTFVSTDLLAKRDPSVPEDNKARLERLKATADNPEHRLEKFAAKGKVDGDFKMADLKHPEKMVDYEVKQNAVYKKGSDHAIGDLDPITGKIRLFDESGEKKEFSMAHPALKGSVMHLTGTSDTGAKITVDWINDGQGRLLSAEQLRKQVAIERGYATLLCGNAESGTPHDMLVRTKELEKRYLATLNSVVENRRVDTSGPAGFAALDLLRDGPREWVRAEQNRDGRHQKGPTIVVPGMSSDQACQQANGDMRIGNNHYYVENGKIYKMVLQSSDIHLKLDILGLDKTIKRDSWVKSEAPCGTLEPGYRATIDGKEINLQNDQNFLFRMTLAGDTKEHWIMGLGEPHRDATGRIVSGGLIDAKELLRQGLKSKKEVDQSVKEYKDDETWGLLGWGTDRAIGGREGVLDYTKEIADKQHDALTKQLESTFNLGLSSNTMATMTIDHNLRSVQNTVRDLNLSATDANEMSMQGKSYQSGVREGAAMAVTTLASGGSSLLVQGGLLTVKGGLALTVVGGGVGSAAVRQTRSGDWQQFADNTVYGGLESALMWSGGNISQVAKNFSTLGKEGTLLNVIRGEQDLSRFQALAKEGKLFSSLEEMQKLNAAGKLTTSSGTAIISELSTNPKALELAHLIGQGKGAEVKAVCELLGNDMTAKLLSKVASTEHSWFTASRLGKAGTISNAFYQSSSFTMINAAKQKSFDGLSAEKFVSDGVFMLGGEMISSLAHINAGRIQLGKEGTSKGFAHYVDGLITSTPDAVVNNAIFSSLTASMEVRKVERDIIARQHDMTSDMVSDDMFEMYKDEGRMNAYVWEHAVEGAAMTAITHPFTHAVTHYISGKVEDRQAKVLHNEQIAFIESKINAAPLEGLPLFKTSAIKYEDGSSARLLRDNRNELSQVTLPDGTAMTKHDGQWALHGPGQKLAAVKDVSVDAAGNISIKKTGSSELVLHPDGKITERQEIAPGHEQVKRIRPDGGISTVERVDGLVTAIRAEGGQRSGQPNQSQHSQSTKISYDEHNQPKAIEMQGGASLVKESSGWALHIDGKKQHENVYDNIKVLNDGTLVKEGKSTGDNLPFTKTEHPDGSTVVVLNGQVAYVRSVQGYETRCFRDQHGLSVVELSGGARFTKDENGWRQVVGAGPAEARYKDIAVGKDGAVTFVDKHGIATKFELTGKLDVKVPGDPIKIDLVTERGRFQDLVKHVADPLDQIHMRESFSDLEFKLRSTNKEADKVLGNILFDVNAMLSKKGRLDAREMPRLIDEALSLAARPEQLSQGGFNTCVVAATQQREFSLHPDTMFRMLRRIHDSGLIVGAHGEAIPFDKTGATLRADSDASSHYSEPGKSREDGKRLRVSQILQEGMIDVIGALNPGRENKEYFAGDIEPMLKLLTGRNDRCVVLNPKSSHDLAGQLLEIKQNGDGPAIVWMDAKHTGARGHLESGGHVRIVKDIRSPFSAEDLSSGQSLRERYDGDGNAIDKDGRLDLGRMVVDVGNTWSRTDSQQTFTPEEAYRQTLSGRSDENLRLLVERVEAKPTDPYERLELAAWKLGFLDASLSARSKGGVDQFAEHALKQMAGADLPKAADLGAELTACKKEIRDQIIKRDPALAEQVDHHLAGYPAAKQEPSILRHGEQGLEANLLPTKSTLTAAERNYLLNLHAIEWRQKVVEQKELTAASKETGNLPVRAREDSSDRAGVTARESENNEVLSQVHKLVESAKGLSRSSESGLNKTVSSLDISRKLLEKDSAYESASVVDHVTKYANYKGTVKAIEGAIERAKSTGEELHFIYIDVRKFKNANQVMGKEGGDNALRLLTKTLAKELVIKEHELIARPGGDELAIAVFRSKAEVTKMVEKIESTYLACRGIKDLATKKVTEYGMKFVDSKEQPGELVIYPVAGAVSWHSGDSATHLMERGDAYMTKRKALDDVILQEKADIAKGVRAKDLPLTEQLHAFDADFQVTPRPERDGPPPVDMSRAPKLTTADVLAYEQSSLEKKNETRERLIAEVASGRLKIDELHNSRLQLKGAEREAIETQVRVMREDVGYKNRLLADLKIYDALPVAERPQFIETISSLQKLYERRAGQYEDAWQNPHTKLENKGLCERALFRAVDWAVRGQHEQGFEPFAVFKVDVDNMKIVNDTKGLGHDTGNILLRHAGEYLRQNLPEGCQCFSPSGGAFTIIAPNERASAEVKRVLEQYGTDVATGKSRGLENSPYVANIDLAKIEGGERLKFGFTYGESVFTPAVLKNSVKDHAAYDKVIEKMSEKADEMLDLQKENRINFGRLMGRKPMEVYQTEKIPAEYNNWREFVSNKDTGTDWQRPKDAESVVADYQKHMAAVSKYKLKEPADFVEEPAGSSGGQPSDPLDFSSALQSVHAARERNGGREEVEPSLDIKESSGIPDSHLNHQSEQSTLSKPGSDRTATENGGTNGGEAGGTRLLSGKELAEMPQTKKEANDPTIDSQLPKPPLPQYELHQSYEAARLRQSSDRFRLQSRRAPEGGHSGAEGDMAVNSATSDTRQAQPEKVSSVEAISLQARKEIFERLILKGTESWRLAESNGPKSDEHVLIDLQATLNAYCRETRQLPVILESSKNSTSEIGYRDGVITVPHELLPTISAGKLHASEKLLEFLQAEAHKANAEGATKAYQSNIELWNSNREKDDLRGRLTEGIWTEFGRGKVPAGRNPQAVGEIERARLSTLQAIVDCHCMNNGMPRVILKNEEMAAVGRVGEERIVVVSSKELNKTGPSKELIEFLCSETQNAKNQYRATHEDLGMKTFKARLNTGDMMGDHARAVDFLNGRTGDVITHRQLKIDSFACFQDNQLRRFITAVNDCMRDWTPLSNHDSSERVRLSAERCEALQEVVNEEFKRLDAVPPKLVVEGDNKLQDAHADYQIGNGTLRIRASNLERYEPKLIEHLAHEALGHAMQEKIVTQVIALKYLKEKEHKNLQAYLNPPGTLKELDILLNVSAKDAKSLSAAEQAQRQSWIDLCDEVKKIEKGIKGTSDFEMIKQNLLKSVNWLEQRLPLNETALKQDIEYMRGVHLSHSLAERLQVTANSDNRVARLGNLLQGREQDKDLNVGSLENSNKVYERAMEAFVPEGFDAHNILAKLRDPSQAELLIGYDPFNAKFTETRLDKNNSNKELIGVDQMLNTLLNKPEFHTKYPDFLKKIIECKSDPTAEHKAEMITEWQRIFANEYPEQSVGTLKSAKLLARLDLLAYDFAAKNFAGKADHETLGSTSKGQFEAKLPLLVHTLLKDNLAVQYFLSYNMYRKQWFEIEAHYVHQRVERLIRSNNLAVRYGEDNHVDRTERQSAFSRRLDSRMSSSEQLTGIKQSWRDLQQLEKNEVPESTFDRLNADEVVVSSGPRRKAISLDSDTGAP